MDKIRTCLLLFLLLNLSWANELKLWVDCALSPSASSCTESAPCSTISDALRKVPAHGDCVAIILVRPGANCPDHALSIVNQTITLTSAVADSRVDWNLHGKQALIVTDSDLTLRGFAIANASAPRGAAIWAVNSALSLEDSSFVSCAATERGGAIAATWNSNRPRPAAPALSIRRCQFVANRVHFQVQNALLPILQGAGGAVSLVSVSQPSLTVSIADSTFLGNTVRGVLLLAKSAATSPVNVTARGGAVDLALLEDSSVTVQSTVFEQNAALLDAPDSFPPRDTAHLALFGGALSVDAAKMQRAQIAIRDSSFARNGARSVLNCQSCPNIGWLSIAGAAAVVTVPLTAEVAMNVLVSNSTFDSNDVHGRHAATSIQLAGALALWTEMGNDSERMKAAVRVQSCRFSSNSIFMTKYGDSKIETARIRISGAALHLFADTIVVLDSVFESNFADVLRMLMSRAGTVDLRGGAAMLDAHSSATVNGSQFAHNALQTSVRDAPVQLAGADLWLNANGWRPPIVGATIADCSFTFARLEFYPEFATDMGAKTADAVSLFVRAEKATLQRVSVQQSALVVGASIKSADALHGAVQIRAGLTSMDRCSFTANAVRISAGQYSHTSAASVVFVSGAALSVRADSFSKTGDGREPASFLLLRNSVLRDNWIDVRRAIGRLQIAGGAFALSAEWLNALPFTGRLQVDNTVFAGNRIAVRQVQSLLIEGSVASFRTLFLVAEIHSPLPLKRANTAVDSSRSYQLNFTDVTFASNEVIASASVDAAATGSLHLDHEQSEMVLHVHRASFADNSLSVSSLSERAYCAGAALYHRTENVRLLLVTDSDFERNACTAVTSTGAITAIQLSATSRMDVVRCRFIGNSAQTGAATFYSPHSSKSALLFVHDCRFVNNSAVDDGGALFLQSWDDLAVVPASVVITDSQLLRNTARAHAGGLAMQNLLTAKLERITFEGNVASETGALLAIAIANLTLSHCTFELNRAERAEAFTLTNVAHVVVGNDTTLRLSNSSVAYAIGKHSRQLPLRTLCPIGSPFVWSEAEGVGQCRWCALQKYDVGLQHANCASGNCRECPREPGVTCDGGDQVQALANWQVLKVDGADDAAAVVALQCAAGMCCQKESCSQNETCALNRDPTSPFCGRCLRGYSHAFGSSACIPESDCGNGASIGVFAVFLVAMSALVLQQSLSAQQQTMSSAVIKSVVYFSQTTDLLILNEGTNYAVMSFFDLRFEGSSSGVCLFPMTAETALLLSLVPPLVVVFIFGVSYLIAWACRASRKRSGDLPDLGDALDSPSSLFAFDRISSWQAAAWALLLFLYSSITKASLLLLQCERINASDSSSLVLLRAGYVSCYQPYQIAVFAFGLPLFIAAPAVLALVSRRIDSEQEARQHVLTAAFRPGCHSYESLLMLRRLALIFCATFLLDTVARAIVLFALCLAFGALHIAIAPFRYRLANAVESVLIGVQLMLAVTSAQNAQRVQDGRLPSADATFVQGALLVLAGVVAVLAVAASTQFVQKRCGNSLAFDEETSASDGHSRKFAEHQLGVLAQGGRRDPLLVNDVD